MEPESYPARGCPGHVAQNIAWLTGGVPAWLKAGMTEGWRASQAGIFWTFQSLAVFTTSLAHKSEFRSCPAGGAADDSPNTPCC